LSIPRLVPRLGAKPKPTITADEWANAIDLPRPASIESYTLGPVGLRLVVQFRMAMSTEPVTQSVDWPPGWPIPQLNDVIRTGKETAGRVQWVEYDVAAGVIRITTT